MLMRFAFSAAMAVLAAGGALAQPAGDAANYPSRTIKLIVPDPPGGSVDAATRIIAERLRQKLGQPAIVENRGGASGNVGTEAFAGADPDGHTLLASTPPPLAINMSLYKKLNYDATKFRPVVLMATNPNVLVVRTGLPVATAQELIAYGKANPGKLNYASQGNGTTSHLTTEMLQLETGMKLVHVPYRGTAPAVNDIISNQMDLMFVPVAAAIGLHEAGNLRILAIAAEKRLPELSNIPTLDEAGLKNFRSATWNAIAAPPGTPDAIVAKLNAAVNDVLKMPEVQTQLNKIHLRALGGTPEEMARYVEAERKRWAAVIQIAGVKLD